MDPDATLAALRQAITDYQRLTDDEHSSGEETDNTVAAIVELASALDEWLTRGGYSPAAWRKPS